MIITLSVPSTLYSVEPCTSRVGNFSHGHEKVYRSQYTSCTHQLPWPYTSGSDENDPVALIGIIVLIRILETFSTSTVLTFILTQFLESHPLQWAVCSNNPKCRFNVCCRAWRSSSVSGMGVAFKQSATFRRRQGDGWASLSLQPPQKSNSQLSQWYLAPKSMSIWQLLQLCTNFGASGLCRWYSTIMDECLARRSWSNW